jgi:amino acid adenylation domain-containing protein
MSHTSEHTEFSTLVDLLTYRATNQPDKTCFTFLHDGTTETGNLTYRELDRQARCIAASLQVTTIVGDRALLLYPAGLDFIAAFFGCLYAGVIPVPVYPPKRNQKILRLQAIASDAQQAVILTITSVLANIDLHFTENPDLAKIRLLATDKISDDLEQSWHKPTINRDTLALLQYTSGSTAAPKGVMVSHENLLHNSECIKQSMELTQESVSVTWLPSYHDMGLIDGIIQPVYTGFPAFLMPPAAFLQQPIRWLQAISDYRATHSGGPNFAYGLCVRKTTPRQRETLDLSCWSSAYNGAEPIHHATLKEFTSEFQSSGFRPHSFYPCYGLAEATLMVTGGLLNENPIHCEMEARQLEQHRAVRISSPGTKAISLVGCGRTRLGTRVIIADPETYTLCSPDQVGEVWVSGPSVAIGYWQKVEKTEETFRAYLADTGEGPFLRTGDVGFLRNNELFLTGRLKDLLIIRGRNHYPQDIELTVEQSHPSLRVGCGAAFAVTIEDSEQLVVVQEVERAYLRRLNIEEISGAIRQAIAEQHELQAYAVVLLRPGKILKTSSGKIQRSTCRAEFLSGRLDVIGSSVLQPENQVRAAPPTNEELFALEPDARRFRLGDYLRQMVSEVLKVSLSERDLEHSLMQLGIDSLTAIELQHRLESELGVVMSPSVFLDGASVDQMTCRVLALLEASSGRAMKLLAADSRHLREHPLSRGQQALWFLHQMAPESAAYNVSFAMRLLSELDVDALRDAFRILCERHPALRTTFTSVDGRPVQRIQEQVELDFQITNGANWSQDDVDQYLLRCTHRPFDLQRGPLIRVRLCSMGTREHILLLTAHHIVVDFWSLVVLLDELPKAYSALKAQQPVRLSSLDFHPADYIQWQAKLLEGPRGESLWKYWEKELADARSILNLPADNPRLPVQSFRGAVQISRWDEELVGKLRGLARSQEATLYMLLLAAYHVLLHRYTGQEDILVGSSVAGRTRPEFAEAVGYFVNQVVLRAKLSGNHRFHAVLRQVKQAVLGALAHQDYPFPLLVERLQPVRDSSYSPLFQTMLVIEKPHRLRDLASLVSGIPGTSVDLGGLPVESMALEQRAAQFDLTLMLVDDTNGLTATWEYNRDLFEPATIGRMSRHFLTLLEAIVKNPDQPIAKLSLLSAAEQQQILVEWNQTEAPYPRDACLHELFQAQVARTPDAIALMYADQSLSYRELNYRANQVAHHLQRLCVGPETMIGVCIERSVEMVVALLGVLKSGGAYVPLDPSYPQQRLAYMMDDADITVLLTQRSLVSELPAVSVRVVCLDSDWEEIAHNIYDNPSISVTSDNLAYVIYTSGSTGRPKGAMIAHRGVVNYLSWCIKEYEVANGTGAPVNTSIGFDATITSLFSPLLTGKKVVLLPEREELAAFVDVLCREEDFSLVKITPAHLELLRCSLPTEQAQGRARALIVGGETLAASSLTFWQAHAPTTRIINEYGPTETVVGCCVYEATTRTRSSGSVPIGRAIANTQIYLLDAGLQPVAVGVTGELHVGGAGMARGYLNQPELTAERFICHPFSAEPGARLYKTGDLARYLQDGTIEFLGRSDDQVKIRGFRIELGEIEAVLLQHPDVEEAAVVLRDQEGRNERLVAYVVWHQMSANITANELRNFLAEKLPQYMIPLSFVSLKALPLTTNGKLDRRALPQPDDLRPDLEATFVLPSTELEDIIAAVWQEVLHLTKVGIYDNFFELGGHSLLAAEVHHKLLERLKQEISVIDLLQYPTISSLAKHLSQGKEEYSDYKPIHDRVQKQKQAKNFQRQMMRRRKNLYPHEGIEEP